MNRLLLASSCLLMIVPDVAAAQATTRPAPQPTHRPPSNGGPSRPPNNGGPSRPPSNGHPVRPPNNGHPVRPPNNTGPTRPPNQGHVRPPQGPGVRPPSPRPQRPPQQHRPGAGRPPSFHPIQRPGWVYPPGYRYRRWGIGRLLPSLFFSSRYYYDSWWEVGLQPAPRGYRWVRYGPDLLLVNIRTRRIADVIYGAFL